MKRIISLLICAVMALTLVACDGGKTDAASSSGASSPQKDTSSESVSSSVIPATNTYEKITYPLTDITGYVHVTGRTDVVTTGIDTGEQSGLLYDHAAQGLLFHADCEGDVTLSLALYLNYGTGTGYQYYTVYVDGVKQETAVAESLAKSEIVTTLTVATGLSRGRHTFEVYRHNESYAGYSTLLSLTMNGVPEKWQNDDSQLKIEFLGDSITSGTGINAVNGAEDQKDIKYYDGTLSYAFVASRILGAEASLVSRSGMTIAGDDPVSMYYYYNNLSYERDKTTAYDNASNQVDLYVISLGANDTNSKHNYTNEQLSDNVKAALTAVRKDHPDVKILWVYGQLTAARKDVIATAIQEMGGEASGYYFYCCTNNDTSGGSYHPNAEAQQRDGEEVAAYIKSIL